MGSGGWCLEKAPKRDQYVSSWQASVLYLLHSSLCYLLLYMLLNVTGFVIILINVTWLSLAELGNFLWKLLRYIAQHVYYATATYYTVGIVISLLYKFRLLRIILYKSY